MSDSKRIFKCENCMATRQGRVRLSESQMKARQSIADFDAVIQTAVKSGVIDLPEAIALKVICRQALAGGL